ncbi:MAG: ribosome biosis protein [Bacteroidota bacterium]|nr:ribosome biosis protein [Bacteroidota bacterium]
MAVIKIRSIFTVLLIYNNTVMKNSYFLMLFIALISFTQSIKGENIPKYLSYTFDAKYPGAKNISWKEEPNAFIANFELDGYKYETEFNKSGEWKKAEKEITLASLPDLVRNQLLSGEYASWNIKSVYELIYPYVKKYQVIIAKDEQNKKSLLYNAVGKLLKDNFSMKL